MIRTAMVGLCVALVTACGGSKGKGPTSPASSQGQASLATQERAKPPEADGTNLSGVAGEPATDLGNDRGRSASPPTPAAPTTPVDLPDGEAIFKSFQQAAVAGDVEKVWAMLDRASQQTMSDMMGQLKDLPADQHKKVAKDLGLTVAELKKLAPDALARRVLLSKMREDTAEIAGTVYQKTEALGDKIVILSTKPGGASDAMVLGLEDGAWKVDLAATDAYDDSH